MTGLTDLKLLERNAFRKFYEDGLFDIFCGSMLVTMGLGAVVSDWLESEPAGILLMLGVAFVMVVLLLGLRRRLLQTRLGDFKPGPERRRKISATRLALVGSALIGLIAFAVAAAAYRGGVAVVSIEILLPLVWFVNAVVVMGAMAYFLDVPRFYLYGFLFGLGMPLLIWPDVLWEVRVPPWVAFGVPGGLIVAVGIFKLRRFLRDYPPLPPAEEAPLGDR